MKVIGKMIKFMDLGAFWIKMDKRKEVNGLMVKMWNGLTEILKIQTHKKKNVDTKLCQTYIYKKI